MMEVLHVRCHHDLLQDSAVTRKNSLSLYTLGPEVKCA